MGVYRFSIGQRFRWENATYEVTHILPTHRVNLADLQTGEVMTTDIQVLVTALFDGRLRFAIKDAPKHQGNEVLIGHEFVTLADCSPRQQLIARYRYWVIEPLMTVGKKNRTRLLVRKRVEEVLDLQTRDAIPRALRDDLELITYPQLSVATVYRWIQLFEAGGYDIRALIPHSHKQGRHKYTHPLVEEVMDATIQELYLKRESCRKKMCI